jgi:hypothetical protein
MPEPTLTQFETAKIFDSRSLFTRHRNYFLSGATRSIEWREKQLIALRSMMQEHAEDFYEALWSDLRRNRTEADWVDVKYMTSEMTHVLEHLRHWMEPVPVSTPLMLTPSHAKVQFDPLGVGLIIGTWNYPMMLTLSPLIAAISAGNAAVIKPPDLAPATSNVIDRLVRRKDRHDSRGKESDSRGFGAWRQKSLYRPLFGQFADLRPPCGLWTLVQCRPVMHCHGLCARVQGCPRRILEMSKGNIA